MRSSTTRLALSALSALILGTAGLAQAAPRDTRPAATPGIDRIQAEQAQRIERGRTHGRLTPVEARRLLQEQATIRQAERRARADGAVTPRERQQLLARLDQADGHISRLLNNQRMVGAGWGQGPHR